jgi:hypothetical protein
MIYRAVTSPFSIPAAVPGEVVPLALEAGASFLCVRPSSRSFSGWVTVAFFTSERVALQFAATASMSFALPFCAVRATGNWFGASVPVSIRSFSVVGRSLPCLFIAL